MSTAKEKEEAISAKWLAENLAAAPPLTQQQIADLRRILTPRRRSA